MLLCGFNENESLVIVSALIVLHLCFPALVNSKYREIGKRKRTICNLYIVNPSMGIIDELLFFEKWLILF